MFITGKFCPRMFTTHKFTCILHQAVQGIPNSRALSRAGYVLHESGLIFYLNEDVLHKSFTPVGIQIVFFLLSEYRCSNAWGFPKGNI